jgi:hypothetical protein
MYPLPSSPCTLSQAIAREEGWYAHALNRPQKCNNPGDLEHGHFTIQQGATGTDGRFAIFDTPEEGFSCLVALLKTPHYRDLTIAQMVNRYAPSNENDTQRYINNVCQWTGLTPDTLVRDSRL